MTAPSLAYEAFLAAKAQLAEPAGFLNVDPADVHPLLKPHQRDTVVWAVRGGRRAIFASFGLGKTFIQLETIRLVLAQLATTGRGRGRGLIVLPLGVRQEFIRDAAKLNLTVRFIRRIEEADQPGIYLTNYETVRDAKLDPRAFDAVSLDEAAVLRGLGGTKTFREFMRLYEGADNYRFVATAVPSPNDYIELLAYAAFLDVMDVGQAKTRFFKRDSAHADRLTLHPHMEAEFWLWVSSWAMFLQKPSDLGHPDDGYDLPPIEVVWHEVPSAGQPGDATTADGRPMLFRDASFGVSAAAAEKRTSLPARIGKLAELVDAADPDEHMLLWHDLEDERRAIEEVVPAARYDRWLEFKDGNPRGLALYERHYSAHQYADGRERRLFAGPGEKTVLLTAPGDALFVWRRFIDDSGQQGVNCAVFRNEGPELSSELIREAMAIAWLRWPGARLYTYVDPAAVASLNPGYCFLVAGWRRAGHTKGGLLVLDVLPGAEVPAMTRRSALRSVWGSQDLDEREQAILDFSDGHIQYLSTKPVIAGSGCNFQRHCARAIFAGVGFKFSDFIQAIHRIRRFLQDRPVRIDLIYTDAERGIRRQLERKWRQHDDLTARMGEIMRTYKLSHTAMATSLRRAIGVDRVEASAEQYRLVNNDTVLETRALPDASVDLIVTSIPFATQYEYTPSYNDFGHTEDNDHFWAQMDYLIPELLRALAPGRVCAVHVKDRIVPGGLTGLGFQTVQPFSDETIARFRAHGFAFLARKTVVTDVVRENNQTYRLGWTEQCKDGSRMGAGMPEYLLLFRRPPSDSSDGYADVPVVKDKAGYSRARWQLDAHGFTRSSGNRPLTPADLEGIPHDEIFKQFREHSLRDVYNFEADVTVGDALAADGRLPSTFMLLQPASWHPDVWTDVARMRTLNMLQARHGQQMHLCLARGSLVLTRGGYKPIQEVAVGEHVLTHRGRWRPVLAVQNTGVRPVVQLRGQGVPGLTLTPDHKVWARDVRRFARQADYVHRTHPGWLAAEEAVGAYVNRKLPPVDVPGVVDADVWWVVGRWLADGHVDARGGAIISCSLDEDAELDARLGAFGGNPHHQTGPNCSQILLRDRDRTLRNILKVCGRGAAGKHLPPDAFTLPTEHARALLDGYLSGDGHYLPERGRWMASSVSRELLLGMAFLAQRAYGAIASVYPGRPERRGTIEGRDVAMRADWMFSFNVPDAGRRKQPLLLDDGAWMRVRSVEPAGVVETWNLRVDEDESYTAEGMVVKNCPLQFDIVDRLIAQHSMPGETVFDPFGGLMTVPYCAIKQGRRGVGFELNPGYFLDGLAYVEAAAREADIPTLFDVVAPAEQEAS